MGDTVNLASRLEGLNKAYGDANPRERSDVRAPRTRRDAPVDVVPSRGRLAAVRVYEPVAIAPDAEQEERARFADDALAAYLGRQWRRAGDAWGALLAKVPEDVASRTMKERAELYAATPPPEGWDGAIVMTEK